MIKSYRLRRLLAPTAQLVRAGGIFALGALFLFVGIGLSFKALILPAVVWSAHTTRDGLAMVVDSNHIDVTMHWLGLAFMILGLFCVFRGVRATINHILDTLTPGLKEGKYDVYRKRLQLAQGPRIVAIGGGTGLSTLLRGLKQHTSNITAIVCVSDDGGSSGKLIRDKAMIPPGDIRNCLVALADAEKSMTDLFQHRFKDDSGALSGHAMGNLLIAALVDQAHQDFEKAVEIASDVLAIRGRVVPVSLAHIQLHALLEGDIEITGETAIVAARRRIRQIVLEPADCKPTREALESIRQADLICIGPGSVYTSIIPNLLVPGVAEALRESNAIKVYICNVMTQPGESEGYSASEHVTAILENVKGKIFDAVMVNNGLPSSSALDKYRGSDQHMVEADIDRIKALGIRVIQGNFMSETDVVRHDPMKVATRLMSLLGRV